MAERHVSDDESDEDFVPDAAADSGDEGSADGAHGDDGAADGADDDAAARRARMDALWDDMHGGAGEGKDGGEGEGAGRDAAGEVKKVLVEEELEFAGERVVVQRERAVAEGGAGGAARACGASTAGPRVAEPRAQVQASLAAARKARKVRKAGGMAAMLAKMAKKKKKINTLEKSRLDWDGFKSKEGIEHELAHNRKGGFLDKQEFLQRADVRSYEHELALKRKGRR